MSFFYLFAVLAVLFVVPFIYFRISTKTQSKKKTPILYGVVAYLLTTLSKMILMATFLPDSDQEEADFTAQFEPVSALITIVVSSLDVLGCFLALRACSGHTEVKIFGVSFAWSATETILSFFLVSWIGCLKPEFNWIYMQNALGSNINLLRQIAFTHIIWVLWKGKFQNPDKGNIFIWLSAFFITPELFKLSEVLLGKYFIFGWVLLVIKFAVAYQLYITSKKYFQSFEQLKNNKKKN
ncbi:transmembrane protein [Anaeramoeba flamelloides]|uniref:BOS complex subunit TMEM147 n=1 Tax=Anaeramoeba flamelloides TaxID=1746091 RepID=A0AAV8A9P1_9EUKA|nr:transmembrane protein [Anaeramoeba flamelloides]KAJ6253736.1 transmembrane protein [Anaeramoeba flamelloides]